MSMTMKYVRELERRAALTKSRLTVTPYALADITIVDELPDSNGLVLTSIVNSTGVKLAIPAWANARRGDIIHFTETLTSNPDDYENIAFHSEYVSDTSTFPYEVTLPPSTFSNIRDGYFNYYYVVESSSGAVSDPSAKQRIRIDRVPPYDNSRPLPLAIAEIITPDYIVENKNTIPVTIPGYAGMEAGDEFQIKTSAGGVSSIPGAKGIVTAEDVEKNEIRYAIDGDAFKKAVAEGERSVGYTLTDRAGNTSLPADFAQIKVLYTPVPVPGTAAEVPLYDNDPMGERVIDLNDAIFGVTAEIPAWKNAIAGDQVVVSWGGKSDAQMLATVVNPATAFPLTVAVSRKIISDVGSSENIPVGYTIYRGNVPFDGPDRTVDVDIETAGPAPEPGEEDNKKLAKPTFIAPVSSKENELTPDDRNNDVKVSVPLYENVAAGHIIDLFYGPLIRNGEIIKDNIVDTHTVTEGNLTPGDNDYIEDAFTLTISKEVIIAAGNNLEQNLQYTVSRSDHTNPNRSLRTTARVVINTPGGDKGLQKATFPDVNKKGFLVQPDLGLHGARVHVPLYEIYNVGDDTITCHWHMTSDYDKNGDEITASYYDTEPRKLSLVDTVNGYIEFVIPYSAISILETEGTDGWGTGYISYTVNQNGENYDTAPEQEATVNLDVYIVG